MQKRKMELHSTNEPWPYQIRLMLTVFYILMNPPSVFSTFSFII